ncbi:MAG: hypothetical protein LBR89_00865 [Holosporales bacterium]|nr:hypothetical protein [Holosporales bacterium]
MLKKGYDDLLREFILLSPEVERTLCERIDAALLEWLSSYSISVYLYGVALASLSKSCDKGDRLAERVGDVFVKELIKSTPVLGNIFKIFLDESEHKMLLFKGKSHENKKDAGGLLCEHGTVREDGAYENGAGREQGTTRDQEKCHTKQKNYDKHHRSKSEREILKLSSFDRNWIKIENEVNQMHVITFRTTDNLFTANRSRHSSSSEPAAAAIGTGPVCAPITLSPVLSKKYLMLNDAYNNVAAATVSAPTARKLVADTNIPPEAPPCKSNVSREMAHFEPKSTRHCEFDAYSDASECTLSALTSESVNVCKNIEELSQEPSDDVLLALCCLSLYYQMEPSVSQRVSQIRHNVNKQLIAKPLKK